MTTTPLSIASTAQVTISIPATLSIQVTSQGNDAESRTAAAIDAALQAAEALLSVSLLATGPGYAINLSGVNSDALSVEDSVVTSAVTPATPPAPIAAAESTPQSATLWLELFDTRAAAEPAHRERFVGSGADAHARVQEVVAPNDSGIALWARARVVAQEPGNVLAESFSPVGEYTVVGHKAGAPEYHGWLSLADAREALRLSLQTAAFSRVDLVNYTNRATPVVLLSMGTGLRAA